MLSENPLQEIIREDITTISNTDGYFDIEVSEKLIENPNYNPANYITTIHKVASLGEGCIFVTNFNGEIENGDYITSSVIPGYGMKQSDDILHNYTVAKSTEAVNWSTITDTVTYSGSAYKKYLIACTYHCG